MAKTREYHHKSIVRALMSHQYVVCREPSIIVYEICFDHYARIVIVVISSNEIRRN